jgi:glycosyltransferase involved in cell wall biosynthesis
MSDRSGRPPVIGIDARKARDYGIGTYTRELIGALAALPEAQTARFLLFVRPGDEPLFSALPAHFSLVTERAPGYSAGELFGFGARIRRRRPDLFHALHYVLPLAAGVPSVVTVHDTIHLEFPADGASVLRYPYARVMLRRALQASAAVISPTRAVRDELRSRSPAAAAKVEAIPHGVPGRFGADVPEEDVRGARQRYALPARYALYLGGAKPHKNLPRVLEAFREAAAPDLDLVLAGPLPEPAAPVDGRVRRIGVVAEPDLPALYRGASFLLYPTLAEGFCFPLLEAMASALPAIVSDIEPCREVAAGAARLVDPRDRGSIARAIAELAGSADVRTQLAEKGRARARAFSWRRAAESTWSIYRRILEDR